MKRVWITWENQRRSIELSRHFSCELFLIEHKGKTRYLYSSIDTLKILLKNKPGIVFAQNPSMILGALVCIYGILTKTPIIIDRHSNFLLSKAKRSWLHIVAFKILNRFTLKHAALTIVTNREIAKFVVKNFGRFAILPDKVPELKNQQIKNLDGKFNFLIVSSFGADEPIEKIIDAFNGLDDRYKCYITGNYKKLDKSIVEKASKNVVFTGFLSGQDYIDMVFSADALIVLTEAQSTMLCGCYEAVTACKPLITSDKPVLTSYFNGAVFIDNSVDSIKNAAKEISDNIGSYCDLMTSLKTEMILRWNELNESLEQEIEFLENLYK
jgi:glycosyltransferase involved in cell wall biosynthesis